MVKLLLAHGADKARPRIRFRGGETKPSVWGEFVARHWPKVLKGACPVCRQIGDPPKKQGLNFRWDFARPISVVPHPLQVGESGMQSAVGLAWLCEADFRTFICKQVCGNSSPWCHLWRRGFPSHWSVYTLPRANGQCVGDLGYTDMCESIDQRALR